MASNHRRGHGGTLFALAFVLIGAAFTSGCLHTETIDCADGRVCPAVMLCDDTHHLCVLPQQVEACRGQVEGAPCAHPSREAAECFDGVCLEIGCGNGVLEGGEACDDGNVLSGDGCSANCDSDEQCGNGILDPLVGESCDCGDATVPDADRPPGCNGPNSNLEGSVCLEECTIRGCGDGIIAGLEDCEGTDLAGRSCLDLGFYGGTLACSGICRYDTAACAGSCGDGILNGPTGTEQCDASDLAGADCADFGYYATVGLSCSAVCDYDTSACTGGRCGDGTINGDESCDGANLGSKTNCTDYGFYDSAPLACNANCQHNVSMCTGTCGDGIVNSGEDCDGVELASADCTTLGYYNSTGLACNGRCTFDESACTGYCGDRDPTDDEVCDGKAPASACVNYGFESGPLGCSLCGPDFSRCASTWKAIPSGTTANLTGIWGFGPSDVFAIAGTTFRHWDGVAWAALPSPPNFVHDIWGTGPNALYGVTDNDVVLRWNGSTWSSMPTGTTFLQLRNVWGSGPNDVFAVGGAILRWNGSVWSQTSTAGFIHGIWGSGPTDVFAVGTGGTILHWNGSAWSAMTSGTTAVVRSVWGSGPNDVFAVGVQGMILHWNGSTWSPMISGSSEFLASVWGTGPSDVYAAGSLGTILHWDGVTWSPMTSGTTTTLNRVWASGAGDVFAIGSTGTVLHSRGNAWSNILSSATQLRRAVWGSAPNNVFAVGDGGTIIHWNGFVWSPVTSGTTSQLKGMWGSGSANAYAVGGSGTIRRWNGSLWSAESSGTTDLLHGVWGSGPSDIFVVGSSTIVHWNGLAWSAVPSGTGGKTLWGVWGSGPSDVYAVGDGGLIFHATAGSWSPIASPISTRLRSVWGSGPRDIFAVGDGGKIIHWNGVAWSLMSSPTTSVLNGVWGSGPSDVFAVGATGTILHWDGAAWSLMTSRTTNSLEGIWGSTSGEIFAVGGAAAFNVGAIIRRPRGCTATELSCSDGIEEDCDGLIDCADPDCSAGTTCAGGGLCMAATTLQCGSNQSDSTSGGTSLLSAYGCDDSLRTGREKTYRVRRTTAGSITVSLTSLGRDVDLLALAPGAAGGCNPRNPGCLAVSASASTANETITFTVQANQDYFLVVDSYSSRTATYSIAVSCP